MFPELCAVEDLQVRRGFFKILNIYTSFQPKLSKCCHEVMVNNVGSCYVARKSGDLPKKCPSPFLLSPVMLLAINMNRFMWLLREICLLFYCAYRQKSLENTGLVHRSCKEILTLFRQIYHRSQGFTPPLETGSFIRIR